MGSEIQSVFCNVAWESTPSSPVRLLDLLAELFLTGRFCPGKKGLNFQGSVGLRLELFLARRVGPVEILPTVAKSITLEFLVFEGLPATGGKFSVNDSSPGSSR